MITKLPIHNAPPPPDDPLPDGEEFFAMLSYLPRQDIDEIRDAFELAREEHGETRRRSGEYFICQPCTKSLENYLLWLALVKKDAQLRRGVSLS